MAAGRLPTIKEDRVIKQGMWSEATSGGRPPSLQGPILLNMLQDMRVWHHTYMFKLKQNLSGQLNAFLIDVFNGHHISLQRWKRLVRGCRDGVQKVKKKVLESLNTPPWSVRYWRRFDISHERSSENHNWSLSRTERDCHTQSETVTHTELWAITEQTDMEGCLPPPADSIHTGTI